MTPQNRLLSLDTLRGFDMFLIMGGAPLIVALCALAPDCAALQWLAGQMEHVQWDGFTLYDTIFPLFLFIAGISFPFSLARQREQGVSNRTIALKIIRRALILAALGIVYNGFFELQFATFRIASVLGRIGLAWMIASLITLWIGTRGRIALSLLILVGYSLLLTIPAPDAMGAELWSGAGNIAGYVDRLILGKHIYIQGALDPEGILSTLPAIVTAMLGIFTGEFVCNSRLSGPRKSLVMVAAAALLLVGGLGWGAIQPINKTLWTSAFVLTAAAYSLAMFALFYYLIDVRGWQGGSTFFRVIGLNSITIYMAQQFIDFGGVARFFLGGLSSLLPAAWGSLLLAAGYVTACWLLLYLLHKKGIYLKV